MKVITFLNSKGGVGKTTLCFNIAYGIFMHSPLNDTTSSKILMIDADPQSSLRNWHDLTPEWDIEIDVIGADRRQTLLSALRVAKESDHTHCLIDTPGKLSEITGAALSMTDLAIIPIQPSPLDVWATIDSIDLVRAVMQGNPKLKAMFVLSQAIVNSKINYEVTDTLIEEAPQIEICKTVIHGRIAFARTANSGQAVFASKDKFAIEEIDRLTQYILDKLNT